MEINDKITKYDNFVNDVLREDLNNALQIRDKIFEDIAGLTQLRQTINCIKALPAEDGLRTQVDLGCNFYVQSHIPDTTYIYINVGLGIHLQLTLDEGLKLVNKKITKLNSDLKESNITISKLKAKIKFVVLSISELQNSESLASLKIS